MASQKKQASSPSPRDRSPSPKPKTFLCAFLGILLVFASWGLIFFLTTKPKSSPSLPVHQLRSPVPAALIRDEKATFARYAGSASCKECHAKEYDLWTPSHHSLAERPVGPLDTEAFEPARSFHHGTQTTEIRTSGTEREVVTAGLKGVEAFKPSRVIGHSPLRQFLVPFPGGRDQTLEATYDPHHKDWFNVFGDEDRRPGEWGHWSGRGMNWNNMCAACHNTRVRKNYTEDTDSYATTMAEMTVGCEACHGPMKSHVDWQRTNPVAKAKDPTIRKLNPEQTFETCAQCHSLRMELTGDFEPGEQFHDHHSPTIPNDSDVFYPDGQVRGEDYEYAAFLGSRMHATGVRCINCHDPHTAQVRLPGNLMCMSCHSGGYLNAPKIDPAAHSFHKVDPLYAKGDVKALAKRDPEHVAKDGGECINCHMPQTFYMQRHRRHDHGFTTPDPLLTKEFGIPNACNRCHTDQNADWALQWSNQWYGEKMNRPSRKRAQTFAKARLSDAGGPTELVAILSGTDTAYWKAVTSNFLLRWAAEPQVAAALVEASKDPNPLLRSHATQALGAGVGSGMVESRLKELLEDPVRDVRYHAAWAMRASIDPQTAIGTELRQILDYTADQPSGQMQKGAYSIARNDPQKALEHYQKAVNWDPYSAPSRHDLAVVYSILQRPKEALKELQDACNIEPKNAELRYKLALAWNELGNADKTLETLQAVVASDPQHARAWYNLGLALNGAKKTEEALQALSQAERVERTDPRPPYARATILVSLGRKEEALQAAKKSLEIQPGFRPAAEFIRGMAEKP